MPDLPAADTAVGELRLLPEYAVRVGDSFDVTLVHTLGQMPAVPGDRFLFEWRESRWISPQVHNPDGNNYVVVLTRPAVEVEVSVTPRNYSGYLDCPTRAIAVELTSGTLATGDEVRVTIRDPRVPQPYEMSTVPFPTTVSFFLRRESAGTAAYAPGSGDLRILPARMDHISVTLPGGVTTGEEFAIDIDARDAFDNIDDSYRGTIEIDTGEDEFVHAAMQRGRVMLCASAGDLGIHYIGARDLYSGAEVLSNPIRVCRPEEPRVFFGDIHGKVFFCGGTCSVEAYYVYARDVARLDFSAVTGVTELFRHHCTGYRDGRPPLTEGNWAELQQAARRFSMDDEFAAFLSFEWQSDWAAHNIPPDFDHIEAAGDRCYGDRNVYYLNDDEPFYRPFDECSNTARKLFDRLRCKQALVIPHHSSAPEDFMGVGLKGADWEDRDDELLRLVEIYSKWGNSEYAGCPRKLTNHSQGRFVQDALAMGHRVGFIGSSDTHVSIPGGAGLEGGATLRYARPGYACVYAPRLTKADIFEGLRSRRCYATTGIKMLMDFYLNGKPMGSELQSEPDAERNLRFYVAGTDRIEAVEIVRNGRTVHTVMGGSQPVMDIEWTDASDMREYALHAEGRAPFVYYYVRVIQRDWEMGWTSPVWVDLG